MWVLRRLWVPDQAAMEELVLEVLLSAAFDATPEKLEAVRAPLAASLRATSLQAARFGSLLLVTLVEALAWASWGVDRRAGAPLGAGHWRREG